MERFETKVGDVLKQAREAQELTIKSVAEEICVQSAYLKAIEDGDYDKLPAQTFAVGFVRSYACALGQDPNAIVSQFKNEIGIETVSCSIEVKPEHAGERRKMPTWLSPLAGIVGASLCWMVWGGSFTTSTLVAEGNGIAEETAQLAALSAELELAKDESIPAAEENDLEQVVAVAEVKEERRSSFFIPAAHADTPAQTDDGSVLIRAEEDSWLRLATADGTEVWAGVLKAGHEFTPESAGDLLLTTSNAGGLSLAGDTAGLSVLGKRGEILIDVPVAGKVSIVSRDSAETAAVGSR